MKKRKLLQLSGVLMCLVLVLTACGSKGSSSENAKSDTKYSISNEELGYQAADAAAPMTGDNGSGDVATGTDRSEDIDSTTAVTSGEVPNQDQEKIIKNFNLDVETQDFDKLITNINDRINSLGGYVESSNISGRGYYDNNVTRTGHIIARIPNNKVDEFVNHVEDSANVTNNQSSSENVTLKYVDTQSRIEALKIEQERLYEILDKAEDLESIITLESRLSDIRYELQNYESQLRLYDNLVDYSTVTLYIQEVERITPVTIKKPSFTERISDGFSETLYDLGQGFQNFIVWFVVNLPYLLIWGAIIYVIVIIVRRWIRKAKKKRSLMTPPMRFPQNPNFQNFGPQNFGPQNPNPQNSNPQNSNPQNPNPQNPNPQK